MNLAIKQPVEKMYSFILAPNALNNIIGFLLSNFSHAESLKTWDLNKKYFDEKLTIISNPSDNRHVLFDQIVNKGIAPEEVFIIENGILKNYLLDENDSDTLHIPYLNNSFTHREVQQGFSSLDDMVASCSESILIIEMHGEFDPTGSFSGIIKQGYFIKDGKIHYSLTNVTISLNVFDIFNAIIDISKETVSFGTKIFPYIKFNELLLVTN
ncbi:hypothetical protein K7I13_02885 [Brucepastera parasyntrophica]|uniref:metallopeptidase TldD-related protein n=1 Tax=Brucepastera parasyntrophica TaxID=2880008 RepID=UPI00210CE6F4|nr:metallopeptidase TldD-related protein [Brucepastera parasyntrophica]ULQ60274.1 hypothetical protein K7I13_02885 [Brucepastera parasyntrophica]